MERAMSDAGIKVKAEGSFAHDVTPEELRAVEALLAEAVVDAAAPPLTVRYESTTVYPAVESADDYLPLADWLVYITVPLGVLASGFVAGVGKKLGEQVGEGLYANVRARLHAIAHAREQRQKPVEKNGAIVLVDANNGIPFILDPDLPDEAFAALARLNSPEQGTDTDIIMVYDRSEQRWTPMSTRVTTISDMDPHEEHYREIKWHVRQRRH